MLRNAVWPLDLIRRPHDQVRAWFFVGFKGYAEFISISKFNLIKKKKKKKHLMTTTLNYKNHSFECKL